ncbi:exonuclease domain-containing protein [Pelotomaculum terephthalicicum JT]|uniref:3'-5' exonuclease n=1 Tax=Pelotomaculum TaxID=191373 RepID=UPI0009CBCE46|nr:MULTISPECIES: 3'-5' exonuclease [Pelotomaculum]MCG9968488.1 exonuclease domain-containing protein [Pelotomaculum terephthalicicum JT]OPX88911.1 MAG: DNA polymerase III PolC-type [Pelotomaculum sp. PtaB.Bin117]
MNYIVFDLEMNNKWGTRIHEIIEIGAVKINSDMELVNDFQSFIKPKLYPTISKLIKKKTRIKQEWIDNAKQLPYVIKEFRKWIGEEEFVLCGWGIDDLITFERNFKINNMNEFEYDLLKNYYDIQKKFINIYHLSNQISLENALKMMNTEPKHNIWHRAIFDAINTSQIFVEIYNKIEINLNPAGNQSTY